MSFHQSGTSGFQQGSSRPKRQHSADEIEEFEEFDTRGLGKGSRRKRRIHVDNDPDQTLHLQHNETSTTDVQPEFIAGSSSKPLPGTEPTDSQPPDEVEILPGPSYATAHQTSSAPALLTSVPAKPEPLSAYTCPICFCSPKYPTLTPCGHVLCGACLFIAVKTSLKRAQIAGPDSEGRTPRCPVCRAPIPKWDGKGGGVIGLKATVQFTVDLDDDP